MANKKAGALITVKIQSPFSSFCYYQKMSRKLLETINSREQKGFFKYCPVTLKHGLFKLSRAK